MEEKSTKNPFTMLILSTILACLTAPWQGYVLKTLWWWYMVPIFHLPVLTIAQALGVAVTAKYFASFITPPDPNDKRSDDEKLKDSFMRGIAYPVGFLLFGWIYKQFL